MIQKHGRFIPETMESDKATYLTGSVVKRYRQSAEVCKPNRNVEIRERFFGLRLGCPKWLSSRNWKAKGKVSHGRPGQKDWQ